MSRTSEPGTTDWRKSSYSDGGPGNRVEIGLGHPALVPVRDSKDPRGPVLAFTPAAWASFVAAVRVGELPTV